MTRLLLIATVAVSALGLTACHREGSYSKTEVSVSSDKPVKTIAKLECPQSQGELTLVSAAPDGQSCNYAGKGSEVTLKLLAIQAGDPATVLGPIETELRGLMPAKPVDVTTKVEADEDHEATSVDLPGIHIKTEKDGSAKVNIGGAIKVDADKDGKAKVNVGDKVKVDADDDRAEVHISDAEQDAKTGSITAFFVLTDKGASGYKAVGYQARGPKTGPIAVAVVKVKTEAGRDDGAFRAAKDLIRLNVGG
ncbi:hypothetical protein QO010_001686 [Caulobacter ginsengisoli]|uniref:Methyltransferase type 11 n=1 Tax=Caulobacter ginsengisoli TaxID=400775 RepID=A0ABU0IPI4_9CAUL|nr:hypothetical protein [Caulobacter ginsengisoli]MDQ0463915.1 hypothetical protein [Caulobacter ginsengisoli]